MITHPDGWIAETQPSDRIAKALFRANETNLVHITRRPRGKHPIKGWGKNPDGRNVRCRLCDEIVWFTNAGGAPSQSVAESKAGLHVLRHIDTTIRIPLPVTFANDFQASEGEAAGTSVVVATSVQVVLEVPPSAHRALIDHARHIVDGLGRSAAGAGLYSSADRALERFEAMGLTDEGGRA